MQDGMSDKEENVILRNNVQELEVMLQQARKRVKKLNKEKEKVSIRISTSISVCNDRADNAKETAHYQQNCYAASILRQLLGEIENG